MHFSLLGKHLHLETFQMDISTVDRIDLLHVSTASSTRPSSPFEDDTVHNISPASSDLLTEVEYDFDYHPFAVRRATPPTYSSSASSTVSCEDVQFRRTLAIVKPEAIKYSDVVLRAINESGIKLMNKRIVHLTPEQVADLYAKHYGTPVFPYMVVSMCVGPMLVLSLAGLNVVDKWKTMVGVHGVIQEEWFYAYSVRTRFGYRRNVVDALHASENVIDACKENRFFYPKSILEPIICQESQVIDYTTAFLNPTLRNALVEVLRVKPIDPVLYLAEWLLLKNPYKPKMPHNVLLQPI